MSRIDRSRITDGRGRHIPVERTTLPPKRVVAVPEPQLRKAVEFRRELDAISSAVRRLAPPESHNPEKFHEQRSELARRVQRLASQLDGIG